MKNLKFTTKTAIALYAMLAVVLSSCSEFFPNDGRFLIRAVNYTGDKKMAIYELVPIKGRGLVFYTDSIAKFNINDTLVLSANNR